MGFAEQKNWHHTAEFTINRAAYPDRYQLVLLLPRCLEDARPVADELAEGHLVMVNLESVPREMSRRLMDFLAGIAYGTDSQIQRVATDTYLIMPTDMEYIDVPSSSFWDAPFSTSSLI